MHNFRRLFFSFGLQQLGEYYARKDELLALQLPQ